MISIALTCLIVSLYFITWSVVCDKPSFPLVWLSGFFLATAVFALMLTLTGLVP